VPEDVYRLILKHLNVVDILMGIIAHISSLERNPDFWNKAAESNFRQLFPPTNRDVFLDHCSQYGHVKLFQWARETYPAVFLLNDLTYRRIAEIAIQHDQLEFIQQALELELELKTFYSREINPVWLMDLASRKTSKRCLLWLVNARIIFPGAVEPIALPANASDFALINADFEFLKYLEEECGIPLTKHVWRDAIACRSLKGARLLLARDVPVPDDIFMQVCLSAARRTGVGYASLEWVIRHELPIWTSGVACYLWMYAISHKDDRFTNRLSDIRLAQFLVKHEIPRPPNLDLGPVLNKPDFAELLK